MDGASDGMSRALDDLTSLRTFVRVVEICNFSEVARRMGVMPATVSKHIAALESRLKIRLINRSTRKLSITDAGQRLYDRSMRAIAELDQASAELSDMQDRPTGVLRVSTPMTLGTKRIGAMLPAFLKKYPEISLHLNMTVDTVDLVDQRIDIAVRIADAIDPALIAIKLAPYKRLFIAAPKYLEEHDEPREPRDLVRHNCLISRRAILGSDWPMGYPTGTTPMRVQGNLSADHGELVRQATIAGVGIMMAPLWLVEHDLKAGRVVQILKEFTPPDRSIHAVLVQRTSSSRKLAVFVEMLRECFADLN